MTGFPKLVPAFMALPSYPISVDAVFVSGGDFTRVDASGGHVRLQVDALLHDGPTGAHIRLSYTRTVAAGAGTEAGKVFAGAADAGTTGFGEAFIHGTFETGHPDLADMQTKVYVAAGRFILEGGKPVVVEYKFSEVVA